VFFSLPAALPEDAAYKTPKGHLNVIPDQGARSIYDVMPPKRRKDDFFLCKGRLSIPLG
jgi:hypothetical protein